MRQHAQGFAWGVIATALAGIAVRLFVSVPVHAQAAAVPPNTVGRYSLSMGGPTSKPGQDRASILLDTATGQMWALYGQRKDHPSLWDELESPVFKRR